VVIEVQMILPRGHAKLVLLGVLPGELADRLGRMRELSLTNADILIAA